MIKKLISTIESLVSCESVFNYGKVKTEKNDEKVAVLKDVTKNINYDKALELLEKWDNILLENDGEDTDESEEILDSIFSELYNGVLLVGNTYSSEGIEVFIYENDLYSRLDAGTRTIGIEKSVKEYEDEEKGFTIEYKNY